MARYKVVVEVVTPDYRYTQGLRVGEPIHGCLEDAERAIECECEWFGFSEARAKIFRSHCTIVELMEDESC